MEEESMCYRWNAVQLQGQRARQEDAYVVRRLSPHGLWCLALGDGLGGHPDGDFASQTATEAAASALAEVAGTDSTATSALPTLSPRDMDALTWQSVFLRCHRAVRQLASISSFRRPPASTLIVAVVDTTGACSLAGVGDSNVWHWRAGSVRRLLRPQGHGSWVQWCVGDDINRGAAVETVLVDLVPGDRLILASDGIDYVDPEHFERIFALALDRAIAEISTAIDALADPEQDNVTVVILEACTSAPP